jgi:alkanesulfonate monooxygenase SsuD/methylene tetrahydromethanopterin reductase-like flavin-dependent oxidoreductase (luciferase family)
VVEAFGTIDTLYPGRIDLGLGRSGQRRAEAVTGKAEPVAPRGPTVVEGTLFPKPFRLTPLILSERFAAAGSVLQQPGVQVPDFDDQLDDVIALLGGKFETDNGVHLSATPGEAAAVELWLFGSSGGQSARAAGVLGLPFVANYHVIPAPPRRR